MNVNIDLNVNLSKEAVMLLAEILLKHKVDTEDNAAEDRTAVKLEVNQTEEKEEKEDKKTKAPKKTTEGSRIPGGVTLEVVRAKLALLSQSGKQAQVKELIEKFGASKLSDIPKSKYASLLREAEAL